MTNFYILRAALKVELAICRCKIFYYETKMRFWDWIGNKTDGWRS